MVNGRKKIHQYIHHIFDESKLLDELEELKQERKIDDLIERQIEKAKKNQSSVIWQANKDLGGDVALNQAQCLNLIDELYGIRADQISKIDASRLTDKKKSKMTVIPDKTPPSGDYADYYNRIKEMARDKGMKEDDMFLLLKDR